MQSASTSSLKNLFAIFTKFFLIVVLFIYPFTRLACEENNLYHPKPHQQKFFTVMFKGFQHSYPFLSVPCHKGPQTWIVYINFREDWPIIQASAHALDQALPSAQALVVVGDKANALGTLIAQKRQIPLIILTSKATPEGIGHTQTYQSITSGSKKIFLSPCQAEKMKEKRIVILDDVISTGGTMQAAIKLCQKAKANIQAVGCAFTEGFKPRPDNRFQKYPLVKLGHLPMIVTPTTSPSLKPNS